MPHTLAHKHNGQFVRQYHCDSCEILSINGMPCHETGCRDAWQDETRECKWCGSSFTPEDRYQKFCEDSCGESYQ